MVRRLWRVVAILTFVIGCTPILLSACIVPNQPATLPTAQPPKAEPAIRNLQQATYNYARYHALALRQAQDRPPDDLLGLKRLAEVCTALEEAGVEDENCREAAERVVGRQGDEGTRRQEGGKIRHSPFAIRNSPAAVLQEALEARTDDRRIVAELLGVPVEDVELGPNLVENGGFEEWTEGRPKWWTWSNMAKGDRRNKGVFAGGAEPLNAISGSAARVNGLWLQHDEDKEPGRCGYWQWDEQRHNRRPILLAVGMPYLLSFYYRTERLRDGAARVWVSSEPEVFFAGNHGLPPTGGEWQRFVAIGWNRAGIEAAIRPLVRSFATGSVEFDNVKVRAIGLVEGTIVEAGETRFWISGSN